jgi:hypothetical protein
MGKITLLQISFKMIYSRLFFDMVAADLHALFTALHPLLKGSGELDGLNEALPAHSEAVLGQREAGQL